MRKVKDLKLFTDTTNGIERKEAISLGVAGGLSFAFGSYIQCLQNAGNISKKQKWAWFTIVNGIVFAGTFAQHYSTAKKCLNALGEIDLNEE